MELRERYKNRADEVYNSLLAVEKSVARRIFLELTQIGETTDTRRRVRLQELVNFYHSLELLQQVSEKLAAKDARLITKTDDKDSHNVILDVVHEALLRHWTQLIEWKRKYQNAIAIERRIEALAQEWQENERKSEYLLQETRLGLAQEYLDKYGRLRMLDGLAEKYIEESQKLRDRLRREEEARTRKQRVITISWVAAVVIVSILGVAIWYQLRQSELNSEKAYNYSLALFAATRGDKKGAVDALSKVLSVDLTDPYAYSSRGFVRSDLGDKQGALSDYTQALRLDPKDAVAYYKRKRLLRELGHK